MKILRNITNGVLLIVIGLLHTKLVVSADGCGKQFMSFSNSYFFKISGGLSELPAAVGKTNFEVFATFWFFYFGILIIPLGLLVHSIEKANRTLPHTFTVSYLLVVILGSYMIPNSGMTLIMLPHALYMLIINFIRARKSLVFIKNPLQVMLI
ncbi:MAG: hypothetical protein HC831_22745, partial [Chloroflexia bacterium]|nr:hypothetical protein [Chloroflexia bacterium]